MSEEPIERRIWLLNWREFREAIEDTDLAILPIGVTKETVQGILSASGGHRRMSRGLPDAVKPRACYGPWCKNCGIRDPDQLFRPL